jgi:RNA methyltransferase, TrmH family
MSRRVSDASNSSSSTVNPRVKAVLRLRDRRGRDQTGLTLVDGIREIRRALAAGASIEEAYVGPSAVRGEGPVARAELAAAGVPLVDVSSAVEARLAFGDRVEGIVAVVRRPSLALDSLHLAPDPLVVVLEGLEKPGNLGAVLRSADGAGADALIVADPLADLFSPNAIRASLGTIFCVPSASGTVDEALAWCRARSIRPIAARVGADVVYTDADLTGPLAFVLGSEAEGLTAAWDRPEVESVGLPMHGIADSLNVSVAAAILLYEARRQRGARTRATSVQANAGRGPDQSPRL